MKLEEKRHSPRITIKTPLRFQVRGVPEFDNTLSDNISAGGISFTANKFIPSLAPLMLEINVLSRILRPIGRVAWSLPLAHSYRNRLGVEFLEFDPGEKNYLQDYINMQRGQL